jgi:hypothetical protein
MQAFPHARDETYQPCGLSDQAAGILASISFPSGINVPDRFRRSGQN